MVHPAAPDAHKDGKVAVDEMKAFISILRKPNSAAQ